MSASQSRMQLLLHAPVPGMLFSLAAPNVAATLMMTASTFADAWFVGDLGTVALASLALVFPFQTLMIMMVGGAIGGGVTSALSRALGRKDTGGADAIAWHGVLIACAMAGVFMIVLGLFSRPIFELMGGRDEVLDGAVLYARIAFGGGLAVWLSWILAAILRRTGDTATPARIIIATGLLQIVMSGALTLGWFGLPAMGIAGPAIALIVCQALAAAILAAKLVRGHASVRLRVQKITGGPIGEIMKVGGLGLINSLQIAFTVVLVTGFVGRYGTAALAGYGLGSRLELMLVPIAFGVGGAATVAVGANFGAKNYARARRVAWTGAAASLVLIGVIGIVFALWPSLWLNLFTADSTAYAFGAQYLMIVGPAYALFGAGQCLYFASQGTGNMLLPVSVGVLRLITVAGVCLLAIAMNWPVTALFVAVAIGLGVIGFGLAACLFSKGWNPAS